MKKILNTLLIPSLLLGLIYLTSCKDDETIPDKPPCEADTVTQETIITVRLADSYAGKLISSANFAGRAGTEPMNRISERDRFNTGVDAKKFVAFIQVFNTNCTTKSLSYENSTFDHTVNSFKIKFDAPKGTPFEVKVTYMDEYAETGSYYTPDHISSGAIGQSVSPSELMRLIYSGGIKFAPVNDVNNTSATLFLGGTIRVADNLVF